MRLSVLNFFNVNNLYILHTLGNNDCMSPVLLYENKIISIYQKCEVIPNKVSRGSCTHAAAHTRLILKEEPTGRILSENDQIQMKSVKRKLGHFSLTPFFL